MSPPTAAARIVWESLVYRLKKRELNNLGATLVLMIAFALPWSEVVYRGAFLFVLNVYVYLMNDYFDIDIDLASAQKDQAAAQFRFDHRGAVVGALVALGVGLAAAAALHSQLLVAAFIINTIIIYTYSKWLKHTPIIDVFTMAAWGAAMPMVGIDGSVLGYKMLGLLALLCSSFEIIQVVRDEPEDRQSGVITTGVLLGAQNAAWIFRGIVIASALYGWLVIGSPYAVALVGGLFLPLTPKRAERTWDIARVLFGLVYLGLLIQVYLGQLPRG